MKIQIPTQKKNRPRPAVPTVALTDEAYDVLAELASEYDLSMRILASSIILGAYEHIEIEREGAKHE